jgi:hypothetical protein
MLATVLGVTAIMTARLPVLLSGLFSLTLVQNTLKKQHTMAGYITLRPVVSIVI